MLVFTISCLCICPLRVMIYFSMDLLNYLLASSSYRSAWHWMFEPTYSQCLHGTQSRFVNQQSVFSWSCFVLRCSVLASTFSEVHRLNYWEKIIANHCENTYFRLDHHKAFEFYKLCNTKHRSDCYVKQYGEFWK